jgi:hypothetical protein
MRDAPDTRDPTRPIGGIETLDAHDPLGRRCVHKRRVVEGDGHVRGPAARRAEEDQVAWRHVVLANRFTEAKLVADLSWKRDAVLPEDVLREAAAIEASEVGASVAIGHTEKAECGVDQSGMTAATERVERRDDPNDVRAAGHWKGARHTARARTRGHETAEGDRPNAFDSSISHDTRLSGSYRRQSGTQTDPLTDDRRVG